MREIYLDNSSTTRPSDAVIATVVKAMEADYGNPSSMHRKGIDAEAYIKNARKTVADTLGAKEKEIFFTSGGTESNNWAVTGAARALGRTGHRILTTGLEHASVAEPIAYLKRRGYEVDTIPVDANGLPDMDALKELAGDDVILVSVMLINNEIGTVLPVSEIAAAVRKMMPQAIIHADAVQAYGKMRIDVRELGVDLLSASGHKINGPKGTGFLYIREGVRVVPLIFGGGQESGMRSGTENVPGIAGLGEAARETYSALDERLSHLSSLRDALENGIREIDGSFIHGADLKARAPHILAAAFPGIRAEVLLHSLEDRGIYISAGSACSTHRKKISPVMAAIDAPKDIAGSTVRFSFGIDNTAEEVEIVVTALKELVPMLARYRAH